MSKSYRTVKDSAKTGRVSRTKAAKTAARLSAKPSTNRTVGRKTTAKK